MHQIVISRIEDWSLLATRLLHDVAAITAVDSGASVIVLTGDLGAGKTTLTQAIARELGVKEPVQSPTFTIMRRYETVHPVFSSLIHMDAYRIDDLAELRPLRFTELLNKPQTLVCIEWGEKIATALPVPRLQVSINHQLDDVRLVTIETI